MVCSINKMDLAQCIHNTKYNLQSYLFQGN